MKYIKLFESFSDKWVIGDLFFGMTEKCKDWFKSPEISFVYPPGGDTGIKVRPVDFEYFLKEIPVYIDNLNSKFAVSDNRSKSNLFRKGGDERKYIKTTMDIHTDLDNNMMSRVKEDLKDYLDGLVDTGGLKYNDVTFLIGKGTLEDVSGKSEGEFFYYSMVNVSCLSEKAGSGFIRFYPKHVVFYKDSTSVLTEIIDDTFEIWGGGKQYVTLFDISVEDFEAGKIQPGKTDEQGWFVLEDLKISVQEN